MNLPFQPPGWVSWVLGGGLFVALAVALRGIFGLSLLLILLVLFVLALMVAIVILVRKLRQTQAAEEIERTITTQADADIDRSTAGQVPEIQRLKQDLLEAIQALKHAKGGRGGDDVLARLPWIMLVGPAGAGKSELVRRSGLHFPLQDEGRNPRAVKGVGGTRGFSWWLAEEGVILDLAGKTLATAAFDDQGEWVAFLETLRKQRGARSINGVIVTVAVDQIADQPESRVDSTARAARERLEELIQHLGVVFPVYVVVNRVDRIAGFPEFFDDLTPAERQEPWGATLSVERARATAAEALFDDEFGVLLASLSERRLARMSAADDAHARARAFAFPLQLERIRPTLKRFVRTLFETSGADAPLFRGLYLTAAAQEGEPADRVIQPAARALGLALASPAPEPSARGGAWFVRDLFSDIVFPDAGLAVTSRGARGRQQRGARLLYGSAGIAFALFTLLFSGLSCANGSLVGRVRRAASEVSTRIRADAPIVDNLRALEGLRAATDAVSVVDARPPWWRRLGGWSGGVVVEPATTLWTRRATESVVAPAARQMEADLRRLTDSGEGTFLDYYHLFRAWRLLAEPSQIQPADAPVLAQQAERALASRIGMGSASPEDRTDYPGLVARQMEFLSRHSGALADIARQHYSAADPALLARAAQRVRDTWDSSQFYRALIEQANREAKPVTLADVAGRTTLVQGTVEVPGAYTKDGWENLVRPRTEELGALVRRDFVLQDVFQGRPPELAGDVLNLYAQDYTQQWSEFLGGVTVAEPRDMGAAAEQLAQLAKGDSPLFEVLRAVRDATQLGAAPDSPLGRTQADFAILRDFFESRASGTERITSFFTKFFQKSPAEGGDALSRAQSPSAVYQSFLLAAQAEINKVAQPGAPAANIRNLLAAGDDTTNPLRQLVAYAQQLGETYGGPAAAPTARLLQSPITGARAAVVGGGFNPALAAAWRSGVLEPFQRALAGRYPFAASGQDASLDDFAACFAPTGYFWTFYDQQLAPFLNPDGTPKSDGPAPVPASLVEFLRKAHVIRQSFFAAGPQPALGFTVRTSPPRIEGQPVLVRWVAFDCGGENATYTMGPPRDEPLSWPGSDPTAGASLRAQAAPAEDGKRKRRKGESQAIPVETRRGAGLWGLFRLLDEAQSVTERGSGVTASWTLGAGATKLVVTYEILGTSVDHPFRRNALRMSAPEL
jgi:type VI secretion system protein ImpL